MFWSSTISSGRRRRSDRPDPLPRSNAAAVYAQRIPRQPVVRSRSNSRTNIFAATFGTETAFDVTYRFTIADQVPDRLQLVLERPDIYTRIDMQWATNRAGGEHLVAGSRVSETGHPSCRARRGEHGDAQGRAHSRVFHELEPAYVLGSFCVRGAEHGFDIVPETALRHGWRTGMECAGTSVLQWRRCISRGV